MLYPENFEQKIGFDKIRAQLKGLCLNDISREEIDSISFSSDLDDINRNLDLAAETVRLLTEVEDAMPLSSVADLRQCFARTLAQGTFLDKDEVFNIKKNLSGVRSVRQFIKNRDAERFPNLIELCEPVEIFPTIESRIDAILDKYGEVKDNASPELSEIRRSKTRAQNSLSKTLQAILGQAKSDGLVDKNVAPTMRDGRLVIPLDAVNKRKINGIVHDESATGKTVFIEPAAVVEVNNRLRELENEEKREIVRILTVFTDEIRPYYDAIEASSHFLAIMDALNAKAKFAFKTSSVKPYLTDTREFDWMEARHPLLQQSLEQLGRKIEPLNIKLTSENRILLISGPNAGGKSVCLKTVGLLQYMLQCGLLIPVSERSRAGIYQKIFIDIGDEQSLENDLSTYSSHLLNMKYFVKFGDEATLLLIDEFGTGTEPQMGGAIAEAVLSQLNKNGLYGVITTHYTNLKHFATNTKGIVNGAMLYDRHHMQPLFALSIGSPGSSFAIEIARKIGLPEEVIAEASEKAGNELVEFDKSLQDAARDKRYWENKRKQIHDKERKLDKLIADYDVRMTEINKKEKDIVKQAKTEADALLSQANAQIENTIRTIKESSADKEQSKTARQALNQFRDKLNEQQKEQQPRAKKQKQNLRIGDTVSLLGQELTGKIMEISGKTAIVAFGQLKSTVPLDKLEKASPFRQKSQPEMPRHDGLGKSATDEIRDKQLNFKQDIDVRGMRVDEALQAVVYYIDDAHMLDISSVRILHGTGTGALRSAIRDYLHQCSTVASYHDEHVQLGGAGITVVNLK